MKCFHHNDDDGRCAGSVVSIIEKNTNKEDFIECNYGKFPVDKIEKDELVYIVDISFSKNTEDELKAIMEKTSNLIWIDHHQSSIDLIESNPEFGKIKGVRMNDTCGALLTYLYMTNKIEDLKNNKEIDVPDYLLYVDDHDCWKKNIEDSKYFHLGLQAVDTTVLSKVWQKLYTGATTRDEEYHKAQVDYYVEKGKIIWEYLEKTYSEMRKDGYEVEVDGTKAFVVNGDGNSWIFGEKIEEYPFVILWNYNGEKYKYSFYSSDKSDFNCKELAEKYGGGGHVHASGCSSETLLFKKK